MLLEQMLAYPNHCCILSTRRSSLPVGSKYLTLELQMLSFEAEELSPKFEDPSSPLKNFSSESENPSLGLMEIPSKPKELSYYIEEKYT